MEFFAARVLSFANVITRRESLAFTRLADCTVTHPLSSAREVLTVFSAERFDGGWPALKIAPKDGMFFPSRLKEVPVQDPKISQRYHVFLSSPQTAKLLSPAVQRLLKIHSNVYLEIYDNALIYHEGQKLPPHRWEELHLHAIQFLTVLAPQQNPLPAVFKPSLWAPQNLDAQVQALLEAAQPPHAARPGGASAFGLYKAVVLGLLLLLLPALFYFIVRHLPH